MSRSTRAIEPQVQSTGREVCDIRPLSRKVTHPHNRHPDPKRTRIVYRGMPCCLPRLNRLGHRRRARAAQPLSPGPARRYPVRKSVRLRWPEDALTSKARLPQADHSLRAKSAGRIDLAAADHQDMSTEAKIERNQI
jgi:hypothetical protein